MASPRTDDVRKLIMDTTETLLENQKLSELSLATIASTAGVSKGTLYYYYKTKNDILLDIMDAYLKEQFNDLIL